MNEVARPAEAEAEAVSAPMPGAAPIVLAPTTRRGLSPLNRRRLANFRRNRLGFWSFAIFVGLFGLSLFAEFIANDKPIIASYKGEILFPVLIDYPDEKFGGFLARTDYRAAETRKEIAENGWAIWPPIPYSYDTILTGLPTPYPSPPTWLLTDSQCRPVAEAAGVTG